MLRILLPITLFVVLIQISFSVYYSSRIIDLNQQFQQLQNQTQKMTIQNQDLEISLSKALSLNSVLEFSQQQTYQDINQFLDLTQSP
jgi:cell division protein FtsL